MKVGKQGLQQLTKSACRPRRDDMHKVGLRLHCAGLLTPGTVPRPGITAESKVSQSSL